MLPPSVTSLTTERYLSVEMPERFALEFQTDDAEWMTEATCSADMLDRLEDGSYICSHFSSGLRIRCVERHEDHFIHVDGGGGSLPLPARSSSETD